jgi:argininosuccinate lyase
MIETRARRYWELLGIIATAHVDALRSEGIIDDDTADGVLAVVESATATEPSGENLLDMAVAFDERIDALCAARVVGVSRLGRSALDTTATAVRMLLREPARGVVERANGLMSVLLEMASGHVVTMLPAYAGSQPLQPTTLAHYLGGTIGPLGRGVDQMLGALDTFDESPMGAGALASSRISPDREDIAAALGFARPIPNTFDAVSSVDHLDCLAHAAGATIRPVDRLARDLQLWARSLPEAIVFADEYASRVPDLPQYRGPSTLHRLLRRTRLSLERLDSARAWDGDTGYGPQISLDEPVNELLDGLNAANDALAGMERLLHDELQINRAAFSNRSGKAFVTSSDLVDFLMIEEHIAPGDARLIANRVLAIVQDRGFEIAAIDRETMDAAGLLVIGREIGIEIEALNRYIAPRRFLEQRTADGAPAPNAVRTWIAQERERLSARGDALDRVSRRWTAVRGPATHIPERSAS